MFDIGFSEIVVIGVVALIVIGPERLPKTARMLGHLFGRLQRYVSEVKADINREMELDELRNLKQQVEGAARDIEQSVHSAKTEFQSSVRSVEQQLSDNPPPAPAQTTAPETATLPSSAASVPAETGGSKGQGEPSRQASLPGFDQI
jgi:sec-independent protein translocase protein TatB